jgi:RHS repeat-associated protein
MKSIGQLFILNKFLVLLLILLLSINMYGKDRRFEVQKSGSDITTGTTLNLVDPEINIANKFSSSNNTLIELRINDNTGPYTKYRYRVELSVTPKSSTGTDISSETYTTTLTVENDRYGSGNFIDFVAQRITGRFGANIIVNSIVTEDLGGAGLSTTITPANVSLTVAFQSERYYVLNEQVPSVTAILSNSDRTLDLTWNEITGAEEYEIEWIWKDNYNASGTTDSPVAIPLTEREFESSNTRVETNKTTYEIPLIFRNGYLAFRIRAIGRWPDDASKRYYGPWSSHPSQGKTKFSQWQYITTPDHDFRKNWQFETSYAEEGKKKEVISYFDGTLRNRQTVTRSNTDKKAIIGEVIYDTHGRPAVEVLPVPHHTDNTLRYYKDFNKNSGQSVFSHLNFDWDVKNNIQCEPPLSPMHNSIGASRYYSGYDTTAKNNWQDFVPNANGFPFSQTEYTPDNTGRIQRKGGVGAAYQLGQGHEIKYFYAVPTQNELNRLFGYHVGNVSHYKKNAVIDPNNQISISYIDPQGRTVATALAGESPAINGNDILIGLADESSGYITSSTDLLNKAAVDDTDTLLDNNIPGTGNFGNINDRLIFGSQILVIKNNSGYNFEYKLRNKKSFTYDCLTASQGYPYVYDLKLNLTDNCGSSLMPAGSIFEEHIGTYTLTSGIVNLESPSASLTYSRAFSQILGTGSYNVSKEIIVDPQTVELYTTDYINRAKTIPGCLLDANDLAPNARDQGCFVTCEECKQSFMYGLSDVAQAKEHYVVEMTAGHSGFTTMGTQEKELVRARYRREWELLVDACGQPCKIPGINFDLEGGATIKDGTSTDSQLSLLVNDMSPTGQYGMVHTQTAEDGTTSQVAETELNVYEISNQLYVTPAINNHDWKHPQHYLYSNPNHYFESDGSISYIYVKDNGGNNYDPPVDGGVTLLASDLEGFMLAEPQWLVNKSDFRSRWKFSYGESLIKYHPEYTYLEYANAIGSLTKTVTNIDGVSNQNAIMNSEGYDTYLQAVTTVEKAFAAHLLTTQSDIFTNDPFFQQLPVTIETSLVFDYKKKIMNLAVNNANDDPNALNIGFDGTQVSMLQLAYASTVCNSIEQCEMLSNPSTMLSHSEILQKLADTNVNAELSTETRNEIWTRYVGYYVSFKQRLNYVFLNVYAKRKGAYNGCIGGEEGDIFAVIDHYPYYVQQITGYLNSNIPSSSLCGSSAATHYFDKEKRFLPVDMLYDSSHSDAQIIADLESETDYGYFLETGICPMGRDLQAFLDSLVKRKNSQGLPLSLISSEPDSGHTFSTDLYQDLGGIAPSTTPVTIQGTAITPGSLTIVALQQGSVVSPIQLNIQPADQSAYGYTWNNYISSWYITEISMFNYVGYNPATGLFHFEILAKVQQGNQTNEIVLTGSTKARIGACTIGEDPGNTIGEVLDDLSNKDCDIKDKFQYAMKQLLRSLSASGNINAVDLNLLNLPAYTAGYLPAYFEAPYASTATYSMINGVATIKINGDIWFEMPLNLPAGAVIENFSIGSFNTSNNNNAAFVVYNLGNISAPFFIPYSTTVRRNPTYPLDFTCCKTPLNNGVVIYTPPCNSINCEQAYAQLLTYLYQTGHFFDSSYTLTSDPNFINNTCVDDFFGLMSNDVLIWTRPAQGSCELRLNNNVIMFFAVNSATDIPSQGIESFTALSLTYNTSTITYKTQNAQFNTITVSKSYFRCDIALCGDIDFDRNTRGDECEECNTSLDADCDGILNNVDNCRYVYNPGQQDTNNNGIGDACDIQAPSLSCDNPEAQQSGQLFEDDLKLVLNAIIAADGPSNQYVTFSHPSVQQFIDQCDLIDRFQVATDEVYTQLERTMCDKERREILLNTFSYFKTNSNIALRWVIDSDTDIYNIIKLDINTNVINQVTNINLTPFLGNDQPNMVVTTPTSSTTAICKIYAGVDQFYADNHRCGGFAYVYSNFCNFFDLSNSTNGSIASSVARGLGNEYLVTSSDEVTTNLTFKPKRPILTFIKAEQPCDCIPQTVAPVAWKSKYQLYIAKMNTIAGYTAPSTFTEQHFYNMNYAYITDAYLYYLQAFNINDIQDLKFKLISDYGTTELGYGYNNYQAIINAYVAHVNNQAIAVKLSWSLFVSDYIFKNKLCPPKPLRVIMPPVTDPQNDCVEFILNVNAAYDIDAYNAYIEAKKDAFRKAYLKSAIEDLVENFDMTFDDKEYQYTLYYYDQAGNLAQTVPPQGVARIDNAALYPQINGSRATNTEPGSLVPAHKLKTNYQYNSLNQLIRQSTPDGGVTLFAYDALGRIIASQNAQQKINRKFSYTRYDELGRIIEAGQTGVTATTVLISDTGKLMLNSTTPVDLNDATNPYPYNISGTQEEVSYTVYDNYNIAVTFLTPPPYNIRNRVAMIYYYDTKSDAGFAEAYNNYIAYDYDIHGNVHEMLQYNSLLLNNFAGNSTVSKRVNYEYDLISGNVNKVILQKGTKEQFIHKYNYDADNRITSVQTSKEGVIWENDAKYYYYEHGPLARVVVGDKEVQGIDYAYTLQGWLKAVNSENMLSAASDVGQDGKSSGRPSVAKDAFGFSLSYYTADYTARVNNGTTPFLVSGSQPAPVNLYNGNIGRMVTSIRNLEEQVQPAQANYYRYDQLNRIMSMNGTRVSGATATADISSAYSYDRNGNIQTLQRKAPTNTGGITDMDNLTYGYYANTNRLQRIREDAAIPATAFNTDLEDQAAASNYVYDAIGQLTRDVAEKLTIAWRADGKVKSITKDTDPSNPIVFQYDGLGNRISKTGPDATTTQYALDAQGNTLGVYNLNRTTNAVTGEVTKKYYLKEHHIYGSSRLGIENKDQVLPILTSTGPITPVQNPKIDTYSRIVGDKYYELSNHLGNVLSVVTDRKLTESGNSTIVSQDFNSFSNGSAPVGWGGVGTGATPSIQNGRLMVQATSTGTIGVATQVSLLANRSYAIQMYIAPPGLSMPVSYTIKDGAGIVLAQQSISQAGIYTLNISPTSAGLYTVGTSIAIPGGNGSVPPFYIDDYNATLLYQDTNTGFGSMFKPDVVTYNNYYPFGMLVPNRHANTSDYRYGFNGKEKDDEIKGEGNSYDFTKRFYDPRIGRFLSIDPLEKQFPWYTPYQYAGNTPVQAIDLDGAEEYHYTRITDKLGNTIELKLTKVVDIYEWQWKPQTDDNSFLGFSLWEKTKNPRKEFVVHQTDSKPIDNGSTKIKWVDYDESTTFDSYNQALKSTYKDFASTSEDIINRSLQGINNVAEEIRSNGGPYARSSQNVNVEEGNEWKGSQDYSTLKEPKKVGPGLKTTSAQRKRILEYNKTQNGGVIKSDEDGEILDVPAKVPRGGKANMNQAEVDHVDERVKGGSNSNKNLRVISKKQNLDKEVKRRKS